jgi:hypothetical protein
LLKPTMKPTGFSKFALEQHRSWFQNVPFKFIQPTPLRIGAHQDLR